MSFLADLRKCAIVFYESKKPAGKILAPLLSITGQMIQQIEEKNPLSTGVLLFVARHAVVAGWPGVRYPCACLCLISNVLYLKNNNNSA